MPAARPDTSGTVRRLLLALLVFGLVGLEAELLLLGHYEDSRQMVPLIFIFLAMLAIVAQVTSGTAGSVQLLRVVMASLIVVGLVGVVLHYRGNLEFQVDMDPTATGWELFKKVIRAKAPPALAPGAMAQLGLLGLIYTYRHPALHKDAS